MTVEDFKKLLQFQDNSEYQIYCDDDLVSIFYDKEKYDEEDEVTEEDRYLFVINDDVHDMTYYMKDHSDLEWTVKRVETIDWQNTESFTNQQEAESLVCELRSAFDSMPCAFADFVGQDLADRVKKFLNEDEDEDEEEY